MPVLVQLLYSRHTSNGRPEEGWMRESFLIGRKEGGTEGEYKNGSTLFG